MTYFENLNSLPILSKLIYQQNGVQFKYLIRKTRYAHVLSRFFQAVCLFLFFFPLFYLICFTFSWWSRRQLDGQWEILDEYLSNSNNYEFHDVL